MLPANKAGVARFQSQRLKYQARCRAGKCRWMRSAAQSGRANPLNSGRCSQTRPEWHQRSERGRSL